MLSIGVLPEKIICTVSSVSEGIGSEHTSKWWWWWWFYTQKRSHTHTCFYTENRKGCIWISNSQFYFSFWRATFIACHRVASDLSKWQFYNSFSTFPFDVVKTQFLHQFYCSTSFRWEELRRGEGTWDEMRGDKMRWDEVEKLRRRDMRWDETRLDK